MYLCYSRCSSTYLFGFSALYLADLQICSISSLLITKASSWYTVNCNAIEMLLLAYLIDQRSFILIASYFTLRLID